MLATLYFLLVFFTCLVQLALLAYAWLRRRRAAGVPFLLVQLSSVIYIGANLGILLTSSWDVAYALSRVSLIGSVGGVNLLWFIAAYTRRDGWLTPRVLGVLYGLALLDFLVIWTDPLHGWYYAGYDVVQQNGFTLVQRVFGIWYTPHSLYMLFLIVTAIALLMLSLRYSAGVVRHQQRIILVALFMPFVFFISDEVLRQTLNDAGQLYNPQLFTSTTVGILLTWAIARHSLLDLTPIALPKIFESLPDAIIISDTQGRITDMNSAA